MKTIESVSENEQDSNSESDSSDPCNGLHVQVKGSLRQGHVMEMKRFLKRGSKAKVFNAVFRRRLGRLYLHYIKWFVVSDWISQCTRKYTTLRRFVDEDSIAYEEAAEAAVDETENFAYREVFERCAFLRKKAVMKNRKKKRSRTPKRNKEFRGGPKINAEDNDLAQPLCDL